MKLPPWDDYDAWEWFKVKDGDDSFHMERRFIRQPMRPGWGFNYVTWWRDTEFHKNRGWGSA